MLQTELETENPATTIRLLGVNRIGDEAGNALNCNGRDLPWLQDTFAQEVWARWAVTYRDVVILDAGNGEVTAYNLTQHDLADPANYAALKALLLQTAGE